MSSKSPKRKTRPTVVELHPKKKRIEKELAEGLPIRAIAKNYGVSRQALEGYKRNRLPAQLVKAVERRDITNADQLFEVILKAVQRMEKLSDACDNYLDDPDKPGEYYMGPRAHDVKVIYLQRVEYTNRKGETSYRWEKRTAQLQDMVEKIESDGDKQITALRTSDMDPRLLLVRSSETLTKQMDTLVQAWRAIDQGKSSFIGTPAWEEVVRVILKSSEQWPEARRAIADGLSKITS